VESKEKEVNKMGRHRKVGRPSNKNRNARKKYRRKYGVGYTHKGIKYRHYYKSPINHGER